MYRDQQRQETELDVMSNKHKDLSYDTYSIYDEIQDEDNKYEELTTDQYDHLEDRYLLSQQWWVNVNYKFTTVTISLTNCFSYTNWLRLPERVDFKMAVMTYRVLHGLAPPYLSQLIRTADLPCSVLPSFSRSTVGRRSFPVAVSVLWNSLPLDIQSSPSLTVFCQQLKTFLFRKSFPHILL